VLFDCVTILSFYCNKFLSELHHTDFGILIEHFLIVHIEDFGIFIKHFLIVHLVNCTDTSRLLTLRHIAGDSVISLRIDKFTAGPISVYEGM